MPPAAVSIVSAFDGSSARGAVDCGQAELRPLFGVAAPPVLRLQTRSYKLHVRPLTEMILAKPYGKKPSLIRPKHETPRVFVFAVLVVIALMMVLGTWAYSVL